jgi:hypothetical protein
MFVQEHIAPFSITSETEKPTRRNNKHKNMPRAKSKPRTRKKKSTNVDDNGSVETITTSAAAATNTAILENTDDKYAVKIKRSNVDRVIQQCNNLGVTVEDIQATALNFFCERRLPPRCHDRNDDDETKIAKIIDRITATYWNTPNFPSDTDLLTREMEYRESEDGLFFICFHESFIARLDSNVEDDRGNLLNKSSRNDNNEKADVRVLKLRFPKYYYCSGICYRYGYNYQMLEGPPTNRNETIEFYYHDNGNKMVNEVDRCIRNLCKPFRSKSGGLSKRMDKTKAFYLMNKDGEVVLLNQALLSRCLPKTTLTKAVTPAAAATTTTTTTVTTTSDVTTTTNGNKEQIMHNGNNQSEYLYVCTHEATGDETSRRPLPVYVRTFKFPMPIPQVAKLIYLFILFWITNMDLKIKSFEYLGYGPIISESVCTVTFGYSLRSYSVYWFFYVIFFLTLCFGVFTLRAKLCMVNLIGYLTKRTYFSWFVHSKVGIMQKPRKISWFDKSEKASGFLATWKACFVTLQNIIVSNNNNNNSFLEMVAEIYDAFFRPVLDGIGIATDSNRKEMEAQPRNEGVMQIVYEEKNLLRFVIYRWVLPENKGNISMDEYENWEKTLRSALGVKTTSQSAPDMIVSDHFSSGVNTVLSKEFLENRKYNDYHVFRIHTPGTRCSSVSSDTYFLYRYGTYFKILCCFWIWFDCVVPILRPFNGCWERGADVAIFQNGIINGTFVRFLWINTCASLALDIIGSKWISVIGSKVLGFTFICIFIFGSAVTFELFELIAVITVVYLLYAYAESDKKKLQ